MDWLTEKFFKFVLSDGRIASFVRHALSALAAVLTDWGIDSVIVGQWVDATVKLLVALISAYLSYYFSRRNKDPKVKVLTKTHLHVLTLFLCLPFLALSTARADTVVVTSSTIVSASPTLDTSAYATGDHMGTVMTFSNALRPNVNTGKLAWAAIKDLQGQGVDVKLHLYSATFTPDSSDNAALDVTDDTLTNYLCAVDFNVHEGFADNGMSLAKNVGCILRGTSGAVYGILEAAGAITTAASDFTVFLQIEQD